MEIAQIRKDLLDQECKRRLATAMAALSLADADWKYCAKNLWQRLMEAGETFRAFDKWSKSFRNDWRMPYYTELDWQEDWTKAYNFSVQFSVSYRDNFIGHLYARANHTCRTWLLAFSIAKTLKIDCPIIRAHMAYRLVSVLKTRPLPEIFQARHETVALAQNFKPESLGHLWQTLARHALVLFGIPASDEFEAPIVAAYNTYLGTKKNPLRIKGSVLDHLNEKDAELNEQLIALAVRRGFCNASSVFRLEKLNDYLSRRVDLLQRVLTREETAEPWRDESPERVQKKIKLELD